ncbi:nudix hydrolase [Holotrichia oblita]|uniref:Nudix hydrolase n=1 Tax=Holotrichia oblita TaxID=644536 RepID=A0ACB9SPI0_HOLOL|nr:nudix hydrolase [Holotrichia oblita]
MRFLRIPAVNLSNARNSSHFALENLVSEENISKTITNFKKTQILLPPTKELVKKAAVLVPICVVDGKTSLLYTLRTSHLRSHKGQVSFPGGQHDSDDGSLENTAIRETYEELGIDPMTVKIWGTGNFLTSSSNTRVMPVVGHITNPVDLSKLNINRFEVEEVFSVSLETLCDPSKNGYTQFSIYSAPVFLGGQRRIWGLTAIITHVFLKSFLSKDIYSHKIKYLPKFKVND